MSFIYKELSEDNEVDVYVNVHKEIFNLSELETYPPSFFALLIRKISPLGFVLGCYNKNDLIGMVVGMCGNKPGSLYIPMAGVLKPYQGNRIAFTLFEKFRDLAYKKGYVSIQGIINPLQTDIAKLHTYIGSYFYKLIEPEPKTDKKNARIIFELNKNTFEKIKMRYNSTEEILNTIPIVNDFNVKSDRFLFEIPHNAESNTESINKISDKHEFQTINLLKHYIQKNNYLITKCFSYKKNGERKNYYLFENAQTMEF